ncbi:MAG: helix-turn-helix domain-containing protein [Pelatocladus maniniholoensis HA4357-MV3]|jgi:DNA-binding transcriptional regulator LsrR (DeoR family)|uniref:Helix-turn-helix domain-containing protein n=1 Tax=Pelatocladus maniniholoensis HA4357-MV3 TaxID=1117104 RepID=A0A9E3H972_9NOST|nr:helix-turn-helix domain-containing protein [Pelatocladus maniniholoensis HA4357-MV3]
MSQPDQRKEIAKAKFITGVHIQEIADSLGVSRRTIERWAAEGNWRDLQQTNIVHLKPKPINSSPKLELPKIRSVESLDDIGIVEAALSELHASLPEADDKSKGGIAGAIARLVELKRKIKPETVADLVERAIELGVSPDEFLQQLRDAWAKRA